MSEITSSIKIEDGFTEPLNNLSKAALKADTALTATAKSVAEAVSEFETMDYAVEAVFSASKALNDATQDLQKRFINYSKEVLIPYAKTLVPKARVQTYIWSEDFKTAAQKISSSTLVLKQNLKRNVEDVEDTFYRIQNRSERLYQNAPNLLREKALEYKKFADAKIKHISRSSKAVIDSIKHEKAVIETAYRMSHNVTSTKALKTTGERMRMFNILTNKNFASRHDSKVAKALIDAKQLYQNEKKWFQYAQKMSRISQGHELQTSTLNILSDEYFAARSGSYLSRGLSSIRSAPSNINSYLSRGLSSIRSAPSNIKQHAIKTFNNAKYEALALRSTAENKIFDNAAKLKEFSKNLAEKTKSGIKNGVQDGLGRSKTFVKSFVNNFKTNIFMLFAEKIGFAVFNKLKDSMINVFQSAREATAKSLDELNLSDKFSAMYGENGVAAENRSFKLANELGENATMVGEMSAKAALQGIGTDDFERIMRFSDKIGKLSMGESTENVANTLLQNVKSGHDADSIAQVLGGGDKMARQLRRAGYERALNRGNLSEALDIAEKIAEQAGFTDEKYQKASNSMSQNYKKIENVVENIKRRLAKIYVEQLAPIVERIKDFLESDTFKTIILYVEKGIKLIGKGVNWVMNTILDNMHVLGVFLGIGIGAKLFFIWRTISSIPFVLKFVRGVLGFFGINLTKILKLVKMITWQTMKTYLPWIAIAAAIAGAVYGLHKFLGVTDDVVGLLAGGYVFAKNIFTNIFTFFDKSATQIQLWWKKWKLSVREFIIYSKTHFGSFMGWLTKNITDVIMLSPLGDILKMFYGYNVSDKAGKAAEEYFTKQASDKDFSEVAELKKEIKELEAHRNDLDYIDVMEGVEEAQKLTLDSVTDWLKKLWTLEKDQTEEQKGIATDTGKIRKMGEQEEELKWLRAFSDRQVMSRISNETSYSRTVNVSGLSEQSRRQMAIMGMNARPSRNAMYGM